MVLLNDIEYFSSFPPPPPSMLQFFVTSLFLTNIQGVSGGIVNILGGGSMYYSERISSYKHVSYF